MWLMIPQNGSCPSAPASACSTPACGLDWSSLAGDPKLWVTVSGIPTQRPVSWRGWRKRPWRRRLFATIWGTLTGAGAAASIGSWLASLASPGAMPASRRGRKTSAGSGRLSFGSDWTFDRATGSWKTCQGCFLEEGSNTSLPALPRAGGMRSGSLSRRPPWAPAICASGCSSWPTIRSQEVGGYQNQRDGSVIKTLDGASRQWATPRASMENKGSDSGSAKRREQGENPGLKDQAKTWPTPSGSVAQDGEDPQTWLDRRELLKETANNGNGAGMPLTIASQLWSTPQAADRANRPGRTHDNPSSNRGGQSELVDEVALWATPNAMAGGSVSRGGDRVDEPLLTGQAAQWATPASRDYRSTNATSFQERSESTKGEQLVNQVEHHFLPPDQKQTGEASRKCSTRRLNPAFVCWLMGMPWFWTRAEPINSAAQATASWRCALQQRLWSLCGGPELDSAGSAPLREISGEFSRKGAETQRGGIG